MEFEDTEEIKPKKTPVNQKYVAEFCSGHGVFNKKQISQENLNKISYNFGVPEERLYNITSVSQLTKIINEYSQIPIPVEEDLNSELIQILRVI